MTEMVERVARAMMEDFRQQMDAPKGLHGQPDAWTAEGGTVDFERVARAGIEAMRIPTEEMETALSRSAWQSGAGRKPAQVISDVIDAALSENKP